MPKKNKKLTLTLGIQTYQILTNDDEVCIPSRSNMYRKSFLQKSHK